MTTTPTKTQEQAQAQETRAQQIARLSNDHLLQLKQEVENLSYEVDHSSFSLRLEGQRPDLEAIQKQVKEFKAALEVEYGARVLRGYRSRFDKLLKALQPPQEAGGRRLIPINAAAAAQEDQAQQQQDALQSATVLAEQLSILLQTVVPGRQEGEE
jgi:exonuclease VII large subunit